MRACWRALCRACRRRPACVPAPARRPPLPTCPSPPPSLPAAYLGSSSDTFGLYVFSLYTTCFFAVGAVRAARGDEGWEAPCARRPAARARCWQRGAAAAAAGQLLRWGASVTLGKHLSHSRPPTRGTAFCTAGGHHTQLPDGAVLQRRGAGGLPAAPRGVSAPAPAAKAPPARPARALHAARVPCPACLPRLPSTSRSPALRPPGSQPRVCPLASPSHPARLTAVPPTRCAAASATPAPTWPPTSSPASPSTALPPPASRTATGGTCGSCSSERVGGVGWVGG